MKSLTRAMKTTKSCYLDANLLVYLHDRNSPFYLEAKLLIEKLFQQKYELIISSLVLDEYEHAILRSSTATKSEIIRRLKISTRKIFKLPTLKLVNPPLEPKRHLKVINFMAKYNLHPRDAYHLFIILENKIKYFATFDGDFDEVFKSGKLKRFT